MNLLNRLQATFLKNSYHPLYTYIEKNFFFFVSGPCVSGKKPTYEGMTSTLQRCSQGLQMHLSTGQLFESISQNIYELTKRRVFFNGGVERPQHIFFNHTLPHTDDLVTRPYAIHVATITIKYRGLTNSSVWNNVGCYLIQWT